MMDCSDFTPTDSVYDFQRQYPIDLIDFNQIAQASPKTTPLPIAKKKRVPVENTHDHTRFLQSMHSNLQYSGTMAAQVMNAFTSASATFCQPNLCL